MKKPQTLLPTVGHGGTWQIYLVSGGAHYTPVRYEPNIGLWGVGPGMGATNIPPTIRGAGGGTTWSFWFKVDKIWTGAVPTSTGPTSFAIRVYAVEV